MDLLLVPVRDRPVLSGTVEHFIILLCHEGPVAPAWLGLYLAGCILCRINLGLDLRRCLGAYPDEVGKQV